MDRKIKRKIVISVAEVGEEIIKARIINDGNAVEITSIISISNEPEKGEEEWLNKYFPIVRASLLSLEDEFLQHEPQTYKQRNFKNDLVAAIKSGLNDFRAPSMDPYISAEGNICYQKNKEQMMELMPILPEVGLAPMDWFILGKEFMPEMDSFMGTPEQRNAFLGVLIKSLYKDMGYTLTEAWEVVCDDSKDIGHYCDSYDAKNQLEPIGSRKVGEWYDLGNTCKIVSRPNSDLEGKVEFFAFGGTFEDKGEDMPLADWGFNPNYNDNGTGWIVLNKIQPD